MKVSILTLGCKVNQSESAIIEGNLRGQGCAIVPVSGDPDYCIVNTCSVTAKSDYQSRQMIRRAVRSGARVIVTGCYSQLQPVEVKKIEPNIEIVRNVNKLHIINFISGKREGIRLGFSNRSRPYIKVQDGCNYSCSYCIVPKARGKSRSQETSFVVDEALCFESLGYSEVVLTGIHLGLYGMDLDPKQKLSTLVASILKKTQIKRIRLSSIEVNEIDEELMEILCEERICNHLHIPLQSGDDSILEKMQRRYTSRSYINTIEKIILKVPHIALGTDVVLGFPGEGEVEYLRTKQLVDSMPFSYLHIFPFSARRDSPASQMPGQISSASKKHRYNDLNALQSRKREAYRSSQVDKVLDVIIEEHRDDGSAVGTSSNYLRVLINSKDHPKKSLVRVRIAGRDGDLLRGIPIE